MVNIPADFAAYGAPVYGGPYTVKNDPTLSLARENRAALSKTRVSAPSLSLRRSVKSALSKLRQSPPSLVLSFLTASLLQGRFD